MPAVSTPTLQESLEQLGLQDLTEVFKREQIDFDSLVSDCCRCGAMMCLLYWIYTLSYM